MGEGIWGIWRRPGLNCTVDEALLRSEEACLLVDGGSAGARADFDLHSLVVVDGRV